MKKLFVLLAVVVLAGCAVSTPAPTRTVYFVSNAQKEGRADFVKALNLVYTETNATDSNVKCGPVSWVNDEFKVTCKLTVDVPRDIILQLQYMLITSYAEAFAGTGEETLRPLTNPDMVVKVIYTTGQFEKQIMSITKYSTLEKIENGSITEAVEWIQEAKIVEP